MSAIYISALHKSSGKTTVTVGLAAALSQHSRTVATFKKGPDYIDPMWLGAAAGRPCVNLDLHCQDVAEIETCYAEYAAGADAVLVEGNKGLFDGVDVEGTDSNAAVAKMLGLPVVLVVDTRGMTRGIAPVIQGYQAFDDDVRIVGVVLNQVGGARHEGKLRAALERYTDVPVLGAVGRHPEIAIDERHLGLMPTNECEETRNIVSRLAQIAESEVDIGRLRAMGAALPNTPPLIANTDARPKDLRIAIARDAAFGFYYPDDLAAFARHGVELVPFDALHDPALPDADGLLIGGGFPEFKAAELSGNVSLRENIRSAIGAGMPVYAECGGLMYLSRALSWRGERHEMVGAIPGEAVMHDRPVGRGYVRLRCTGAHPWPGVSETGAIHPAHEFHYASLEGLPPGLPHAYEMVRGHGLDGINDGLIFGNMVAGFTHLRNVANTPWVGRFVEFVRSRRSQMMAAGC